MTIDVVVLFGSGRRNGNSEAAVEEALKAILQSGDKVVRFHLSEMSILHCRACNACVHNGGVCVLKDGMEAIYESIQHSDLLLIATPIYFSGPSSFLKQAIDRCQCLWVRKNRDHQGRWGALVMVSGQKEANFRNTISISRSFLNSIPVQYAGDISLAGYDEAGDLLSDPHALQQAFSFGERVGRMVRNCPGPERDARLPVKQH